MRPLLVMVALLLLAGGVQGDVQPQTDDPETVVITVDSTNLRFSPSQVTITEGDTVRFFWSGQALPHNAVESNGVFDSGDPERAVDYSFTFERGMNGTYDFVCEPHESAGMVGQITVESAAPLIVEEPEPMEEENTPFLSGAGTLVSLLAAWAVVLRRQGSGCNQPKMSSSVSF